jgi:hypothetical protein
MNTLAQRDEHLEGPQNINLHMDAANKRPVLLADRPMSFRPVPSRSSGDIKGGSGVALLTLYARLCLPFVNVVALMVSGMEELEGAVSFVSYRICAAGAVPSSAPPHLMILVEKVPVDSRIGCLQKPFTPRLARKTAASVDSTASGLSFIAISLW